MFNEQDIKQILTQAQDLLSQLPVKKNQTRPTSRTNPGA
jgi:hypothetical protein